MCKQANMLFVPGNKILKFSYKAGIFFCIAVLEDHLRGEFILWL